MTQDVPRIVATPPGPKTREILARQERVLYPGLSEAEEIEHRRVHGIPLHREVIEWFGGCTREMGLPALAVMA